MIIKLKNLIVSTAGLANYLEAVGFVLLSTGVAFLIQGLLPHAALTLLFLTVVLFISSRTNVGPSLTASVLSFLALNFFFTQPFYTLKVSDDGDVATLFIFLIVSAITGNLATRMHREIAQRQVALKRISNFYDFSRRMSSATSPQDVLFALAEHLSELTHSEVAVFTADDKSKPLLTTRTGINLQKADLEQAWEKCAHSPWVSALWSYFSLWMRNQQTGMIAFNKPVNTEQSESIISVCEQASAALERIQLVTELEQAKLVSETEQLRSALLSSISHDLRTPLSSIIGSSSSLMEYGDAIDGANRQELLSTVLDEAKRLDRHIQNLLDMTKLGQGNLTLKRDWVDVHDVISSAVSRLKDVLGDIDIHIQIADSTPLIWVHGVLIEQAIVNLIDNAARFSEKGDTISIEVEADEDSMRISIYDQGPGIPEDERDKVFDMFYSMQRGDRATKPGTGLGLAIVRGMIGAHAGEVTAHAGKNGQGTCMTIKLPLLSNETVAET